MTRTSEPHRRPAIRTFALIALLLAGVMFANVKIGQSRRAQGAAPASGAVVPAKAEPIAAGETSDQRMG